MDTSSRDSSDDGRPEKPRDPYRIHPTLPTGSVRAVAGLALAWGLVYLGWRVTSTATGAHPVLFWMLFTAEVMGLLSLAFAAHRTRTPSRWMRQPIGTNHEVDIFVTTHNDPIETVRTTMVATRALTYPAKVWLLDDESSPEIEAMASEFGATYLARDSVQDARGGNLNHALSRTDAELVLLLSAGDVPLPDMLDAVVPEFLDVWVAVVQPGYEFSNRDSVEHANRYQHDQAFDLEVIAPSMSTRNQVPWMSRGPSVIRRSALQQVGGFATDTQAPQFQTGIRLHRQGFAIRFLPETLAEIRAPHDLESLLRGKERFARGQLGVFRTPDNPLWAKGLTFGQRIAYTGWLYRYLMSAQRLLLLATAIGALTIGALPLVASVRELAGFWFPAYALAGIARVSMGRGRLGPLDTIRRDLRTLGVDLASLGAVLTRDGQRFRFLERVGISKGGLPVLAQMRLLTLLLVVLDVALIYRAIAYRAAWEAGDLDGFGLYATVLCSLWAVALILNVMQILILHRQERTVYRIPVRGPALLGLSIGELVDLTPRGFGIEADTAYEAGDEYQFRFPLTDLKGKPREVTGQGIVRYSRPVQNHGQEKWRIGVEVSQVSVPDRDWIIEYCSVVHPYRTLRGRLDRTLSLTQVRT
ncbi:MAG: glycosyltransferase [Actinomycetia bacterium]|nr:glycosyltransferase [Actinomycetes bacterium]